MVELTSPYVYDSTQEGIGVLATLNNLWRYRGLIRLLVARNLTLRYKRSILGVWWTLLNPLLIMTVMWVLFSQLFHFQIARVPYIVYMFSGVILINFFQHSVLTTGASVVDSSGILTKVYVPAEVFCIGAAAASAANFLITVIPLLAIQLAIGPGIPWTVALVPLSALSVLAFSAGIGLIMAALTARFYDGLDLAAVGLQLVGWLTPTFYPEAVVPPAFRLLLHLNPMYHQLTVFRSLVYEGALPPTESIVISAMSATMALLAGLWVFSRSWKAIAVML